MNEMIERVAFAIKNSGLTCGLCSVGGIRPDCCCYVGALAAIEAMREPSDAMIGAGEEAPMHYSRCDPASTDGVAVWKAMIEAALRD